jgi:hypothetical protein
MNQRELDLLELGDDATSDLGAENNSWSANWQARHVAGRAADAAYTAERRRIAGTDYGFDD